MKPATQCFVSDGDKDVIESFGIAEKAVVISTTNFEFLHPSRRVESLTLTEALQRPLAISQGTLSHEDVVYINSGVCILSLSAETFAQAGIEAKKQAGSEKYVAEVSLDDGPAHKRLIWAAENTLTKPFKFYVPGPEVEAIDKVGAINTPPFDCPSEPEAEQDWANAIQEWVGLVAIGSILLEHNHGVERAVSDFHIEGTSEFIHVAEIEGLLTPKDIAHIWQKATVLLVSSSGEWPVAFGKSHVPSDNPNNPAYILVRGDQGSIKALKFVPWQDL